MTAQTPQTVKSFRQAHTNTSKSSTFMPLPRLPLRQAPRIPQSSKFLCLFLTRPSGRLYEYFKVPVFYASTPPAAPAGRTNTSKFPVSHASVRPAETSRPFEYLKAPLSNASSPPAPPAGHSNTKKVKAQVPPPFKSLPKGNFTTLSPDPPPSVYLFPAAFRRW